MLRARSVSFNTDSSMPTKLQSCLGRLFCMLLFLFTQHVSAHRVCRLSHCKEATIKQKTIKTFPDILHYHLLFIAANKTAHLKTHTFFLLSPDSILIERMTI